MHSPVLLKNRPFLRKFLISYLAILSIPMVLSFFLSRNSSQAVRDYVEKSNNLLISQTAFVIDRRIRDMENLVLQIGQNRRLDALSKTGPETPPDFTFKLSQAMKEISTFMMQENNLSHDYYIVFDRSGYVIDGSSVISYDSFFDYKFRYGDLEREDWIGIFHRYHRGTFLPAREFFNGSEVIQAIPFIKTIPFYFNSEGSAHVIFMIDAGDLAAYFTSETGSQSIPRLIRTEDGQDLLPFLRAPGRRYGSFTQRSSLYNLDYELLTPYEDVYSRFVTNRAILILANIATFLMGAFAAIYFSRANADPLRHLSEKLTVPQESPSRRVSPYDSLNRAVEQIISSKDTLESIVARHKSKIGEAYYYRLVKYGFESPGEMNSLSSYLDKELPRGLYGIILLNFYFEPADMDRAIMEEARTLKLTVLELVRSASPSPSYWMDLDSNSIGYIFCTDSSEDRELWFSRATEEIGRINQILFRHDINVFWTVGDPVNEAYNLNSSYLQARLVMEESTEEDKKRGVICYGNFSLEKEQYNLPMEFLQKLILLGKSGNYELARELFLENWEENIKKKQISAHMLKLYLSDLRGLINRLRPDSMEFSDYDHLPEEEPSLMKDRVLTALENVSRSSQENKKSIQDKLLESLYDYIEQNYADPNLTLSSLSRTFNRSEGYLSHLFKQQGGENFYALLERNRLSKSTELLDDMSLSINEVALKSGYSNVRTYRRAFKKIKGISPTEYRENR